MGRIVPPVNDLQCAAPGGGDGLGQFLIGAHRLAVGRDNHIPQTQPGLLGGILGSEIGMQIAERHNEGAVREHLDAKGGSADGDLAPRLGDGAHRLEGNAQQCDHLIAAGRVRRAAHRGGAGARRGADREERQAFDGQCLTGSNDKSIGQRRAQRGKAAGRQQHGGGKRRSSAAQTF